jgi:ribosomal protein S18 acetylase RimI-like enzyme
MSVNAINLKRTQIAQAVEILSNAFDSDPMFLYIMPSEEARRNITKFIFGILLRENPDYQHIYTTALELKGIAVWVPPGRSALSFLGSLQLGLLMPFKLGLPALGRSISVFSIIDNYHKQDMQHPHWYLANLGVAPAYQGQGIGASLLQPVLKRADSEGLPCYLETSTSSAVRFYQRQGFEILRIPELPENAPPMWTMKREAR